MEKINEAEYSNEYSTILRNYYDRANLEEVTISHVSNLAEELGLATATSMLTVGPGPGIVEAGIIKAMPQLEAMYAIEPDHDNCVKLKEQGFPVKFDLQEATLEDVDEFDNKVDIIFLSHVVGHMHDCFDKQLTKLMGWLKPSGSLLVLLPDRGCVYSRVGLKFNDPISSYTADDVRKLLRQRESEEVKEFGPAVYRINVKNIDSQFATLVVHRKLSKEESEDILKFIDQETGGSGEILRNQIIFKITAKK